MLTKSVITIRITRALFLFYFRIRCVYDTLQKTKAKHEWNDDKNERHKAHKRD